MSKHSLFTRKFKDCRWIEKDTRKKYAVVKKDLYVVILLTLFSSMALAKTFVITSSL